MKGFSLIEVLLTTLLVLLALGLIASTANEYTRISRHIGGQDTELEIVQRAMTLIANELREAVVGVAPTSPAISPTLAFEKVDYRTDRFAPPEPASFEPMSTRVAVVYQLNGQQLVRRSTDGAGVHESLVADGVTDFGTRLLEPGLIELRITFQKNGRTLTLRRDLHLWSGRW